MPSSPMVSTLAVTLFGCYPAFRVECLPRGSIVVPFWGSYLEFYKVFPKRNYHGAYGYWEGKGREGMTFRLGVFGFTGRSTGASVPTLFLGRQGHYNPKP